MTTTIHAELEAAIDRLQGTVAILKFVEQRLPERGNDADLAALNGVRIARERLLCLTSQLGLYAMAERQAYTDGQSTDTTDARSALERTSDQTDLEAKVA